jgi:hypothetical protein
MFAIAEVYQAPPSQFRVGLVACVWSIWISPCPHGFVHSVLFIWSSRGNGFFFQFIMSTWVCSFSIRSFYTRAKHLIQSILLHSYRIWPASHESGRRLMGWEEEHHNSLLPLRGRLANVVARWLSGLEAIRPAAASWSVSAVNVSWPDFFSLVAKFVTRLCAL